MNKDGQKLLNLMFSEEDTICLSDSKFAYHAIPFKTALSNEIPLVSPNSNVPIKCVSGDQITLIALNPIQGHRSDAGCYKFKNFLLELDYGDLNSQKEYIKKLGIPISACIYSGNRSLHFLVSLSESLPSEKIYRFFSEWMLNVATLCDQNCKNPSRSIRLPGNVRPDTGKLQTLEWLHGSVKLDDLVAWLKQYPNAKPKQKQQLTVSKDISLERVKPWVSLMLKEGIKPPNRNKKWFSAAVEFCLSGHSEDDTIDILGHFFMPDNDFKEREWETTIKSAFKWAYERKT